MSELKFHRLLNRIVKPTYIHQTLHIVECLIVSMQSAVKEIEENDLGLALSMYALYLKPFDEIVRNHPTYEEFEAIYEKAVRLLAESDLVCPCSVCEDITDED